MRMYNDSFGETVIFCEDKSKFLIKGQQRVLTSTSESEQTLFNSRIQSTQRVISRQIVFPSQNLKDLRKHLTLSTINDNRSRTFPLFSRQSDSDQN